MNFIPIIIIIWILAIVLSLYFFSKPDKSIIKKYGRPIHHFYSRKCWKTMPIRGTCITMDFYSDFIVISDGKNEWIINKNFKDYKFYGSYLTLVFEFELNQQKIQMLITRKQKKLLCEFFKLNNDI